MLTKFLWETLKKKAKDLIEILAQNPDFDVKIMIQEPSNSWPSFFVFDNVEIGDIGYSSKAVYLHVGQIPCKVGDTVYTVIGTDKEGYFVDEGHIISFCTEESGISFYVRFESGLTYWYSFQDIGTEVFLTKEEADTEFKKKGS